MIEPRYLIVIPDERARLPFWRARCQSLEGEFSDAPVEHHAFLVFSNPAPIEARADEQGTALIFGAVFGLNDFAARATLTAQEAAQLIASRGASLIDHFWGSYVALVASASGADVVRAPFGDLPCYYCQSDGAIIVASHLDLLIQAAGRQLGIDWEAVTHYLIAPDIRHGRTCLASLMELAGGQRLPCGRQVECSALWSPWTFAGSSRRCDDRDEAASRLRQTIVQSVRARTCDASAPLLLLSGGLDSSIVAAALTASGRRAEALTMVTTLIAGDERRYARLVAEHCDMRLHEVFRDVSAVDVERSLAANRPYPCERSFTQATRSAVTRLRDRTGADVVLHGGGGDHIFCSLQSAAPLADLLATRGPDRRAPALVTDLAEVAQVTSAAVLRQALARLARGRARYAWPTSLDLLSPVARRLEAATLAHPWLAPPQGVRSAGAGHVALVLGALGIVQSTHASWNWRAILLSQPVVETCLTIPPWLWFERGRNRAAARNAFASMLPGEHAWRLSKGVVDSFLIEVFEANRTKLRTMLMDGQLVAHGIVDPGALISAIDQPGPVRGNSWGRILLLADVEAWLRSWSGRGSGG